MKIEAKRITEFEVTAIKCEMAVRYEEEDIPNDFPLRKGDMWTGIVDIETGIIRDWPVGKSGHMQMKVCDEGVYTLLGADDVPIESIEGYVPSCIPGSYGDYVDFDIDENSKIANWENYCTAQRISESFFRDEDE